MPPDHEHAPALAQATVELPRAEIAQSVDSRQDGVVVRRALQVEAGAKREPARWRHEQHRWELLLIPSFVTAAILFALAIGTGTLWPMAPAVVFGPIAMAFVLIHLCVSADSNGPR
jgi:hypothetical protein